MRAAGKVVTTKIKDLFDTDILERKYFRKGQNSIHINKFIKLTDVKHVS